VYIFFFLRKQQQSALPMQLSQSHLRFDYRRSIIFLNLDTSQCILHTHTKTSRTLATDEFPQLLLAYCLLREGPICPLLPLHRWP
jgi:hypothetical protein